MTERGPAHVEAERVRAAYARRAEQGADDRYGLTDPANLYLFQRRERALVELLRRHELLPLTGRRILDVGCGNGAVLRDLQRLGARPRDLAGVDLLAERVEAARAANPAIAVTQGDATRLPYRDASFDVAVLFTVVSSILDQAVRRVVASEAVRVVRPGGVIVWYDFTWNPGNRDTRGVGLAELRALFAGCDVDARRVTLAPPIGRRVARRSFTLAAALEAIPLLRTHYLAAITKPVP
ncbi:MAG TPA: class I SAM-dependent methyltransferase [Dehalococcoidia bacterium]|nr:class I SAM-dependent methyltransferase [Dehalococcoidia bacterium]